MAGFRARSGVVLLLAIASTTGCNTPIPGSNGPASTPTPLATEAPNLVVPTPKPLQTPQAKPANTPPSGSFYKPPGWDGVSDVDCPDFDSHAHAQSFFIGTHGSKTNDPYRLDSNHDGVACESLP